MTGLLTAYRLATRAAELIYLPHLLRRRARHGKEEADRLDERFGRERGERPPGRLLHLHGVSVGETLSLLPLIEALRRSAPDVGLLVTSGTVTSAALMRERLPGGALHRYAPVDAPGVVGRWVKRWRPDLSIFVESDIWPNWLQALRASGARTALLSARLSENSLRTWAAAPASAKVIFGGFDFVAAQDDATASELFHRLGARDDGRLNLKRAGGPLPVDPLALARARAEARGARVLVAASTHPGEDEIVLDAWRRLTRDDALLVIAPRHPERGPSIHDLAAAGGLATGLRSAGDGLTPGGVYVADSLGEMGLWLTLAAQGGSVLVAGSLVPGPGGHNPLEPIRVGAPIVRGPFVENWAEVYAGLGEGVPVVADAAALAEAWADDLKDAELAAGRAERLRAGVTEDSLHHLARRLLDLLPPAPSGRVA